MDQDLAWWPAGHGRRSLRSASGYALNAGATEDELKEIVYLTTIPGGFPRAIQASQALAELLAARRAQ